MRGYREGDPQGWKEQEPHAVFSEQHGQRIPSHFNGMWIPAAFEDNAQGEEAKDDEQNLEESEIAVVRDMGRAILPCSGFARHA